MSMISENIKVRPAILTLHILALCKLGFLGSMIGPFLALQKDLTPLGGLPLPGMNASLPLLLMQALVLGLGGVAMAEAAAYGLSRRKNWGWILAIVVAILQLPSLLFPFSFCLGWFLLPDTLRQDISGFMKREMN